MKYPIIALAALLTFSFDSFSQTVMVDHVGGTSESQHQINLPDGNITYDQLVTAIKEGLGKKDVLFTVYEGDMLNDDNVNEHVQASQETGTALQVTAY
jgi:hypothetical protein